jgi:mycothiol synthase
MLIDEITLPGAPAIPGLAFRHFRGAADFPGMLAVSSASAAADKLERVHTLEQLKRNYSHLVNCDPATDLLMAEVNGELVAFGRVEWAKRDSGERLYLHSGNVHPHWRRRGLGRAVLRHNQQRLREIAAAHPADGPRFFEAQAHDSERAAEALLLSEGYTAIRHFFTMVRPTLDDIPDLPLPPGLEIRPALPEHYPLVFAALDEAFRDHWGYTPIAPEQIANIMESPFFQPDKWQAAWDPATNEIAGLVLGAINNDENEKFNRRRGYTDPIGVRRPWRKQGLARALIVRSLRQLRDLGMTEAALTVDTENLSGALHLYEGLGYRPVKRGSAYRKPLAA